MASEKHYKTSIVIISIIAIVAIIAVVVVGTAKVKDAALQNTAGQAVRIYAPAPEAQPTFNQPQTADVVAARPTS
ncbi:MAG: hypothetical protein ABIA93_02890 [Candidatus Woesearchaeota archaeon]